MVSDCALRLLTAALCVAACSSADLLSVDVNSVEVVIDEPATIQFYTTSRLATRVDVSLMPKSTFRVTPQSFTLSNGTLGANVTVVGTSITSSDVIEVAHCLSDNDTHSCPFSNAASLFVGVRVVHSHAISLAVVVVGWIYFTAWSISFYPQIYLNFSRKSVVGLNFDFLLLNTIGFTCYSVYNCFMYFDTRIQELYEVSHPHSNLPVLTNDVVFALHALFACLLTATQCFVYKSGGQRISFVCLSISAAFVLFALSAVVQMQLSIIDAWQFVTFLSYIKMASTLCKYFPQAILNFRRKSTVGWSIGNVLLDFLGGAMDILQMVLQGANTDDWSSFYGNTVKFGLGLVSIVFDVVFMLQHYVLYRGTANKVDCEQQQTPSHHKVDAAPGARRNDPFEGANDEVTDFLYCRPKAQKSLKT